MPQDWINIHTHRPGEGVNIVDPCLGNVIMPGQGAVYFSLGIHPMYIDDMVEERLQKIELAAAEGKIVAVGGPECACSDGSAVEAIRTAGGNCRTVWVTVDYSWGEGNPGVDYCL